MPDSAAQECTAKSRLKAASNVLNADDTARHHCSLGLIKKTPYTGNLQTCAATGQVTWKMGASGSELIATIHLESFMPAKCWMAPEMPRAMYSCGATTLPV